VSLARKSADFVKKFTQHRSYPLLVGLIVFLDAFIFFIPIDGLLVSSVLASRKRWLQLALATTVGTSLGTIAFAYGVETFGSTWVQETFPILLNSEAWTYAMSFLKRFGQWACFVIALTPLAHQPVVIASALAKIPWEVIGAFYFAGRLIKYLFLSYLTLKSPEALKKLWGIKGELKDAQVLEDSATK
jgi:membrane protein YqaA with SNARE-associated domain